MIGNFRTYRRLGPSTAPIVFVCIVLGMLGLFFMRSPVPNNQKISMPGIVAQSAGNTPQIDTDNDGLKDWEEQIYGTNPHDPDTDHDTTNDGDEIAQGRDPIIPGPNDLLTKKTISMAQETTEGDRPNLTQQLVEIFGQDYLAKFVQNPTMQIDADAIADKLVSTMQNSSPLLPEFTIKDIIILRDPNQANVTHYVTTFDNTLITAFGSLENMANTIDLIARMVKNQDDDAPAAELIKQIDAYTVFLGAIKKVPVPKDFIDVHLSYLNTAQKEREAIKKIMKMKTDAATAFVGMRQLLDTIREFKDIADQYHTRLKAYRISLIPEK